jgi:CPA2 family monovalent cation:H+ antiporter-2
MVHVPLLEEVAVIAGIAVMVSVVLSRFRVPTVTGLLATGALVGPNALGLVTNQEDIEILAEVGVVLLLFTIGLEFSLARLGAIFRTVALGGAIQVAGTIAVVVAIATALGFPVRPSIFFGFVFALSSTAVVLRGLAERRELDAPHGRFIVGTLIFQDVLVVPMVLLVPVLASDGSASEALIGVAWALGKAVVVVVMFLIVARAAVPWLLKMVDATRNREVFVLAVLAICIGTAWATAQTGLSLALGAFLGGMVVADTEFRHRAMGDMLPLRDVFVSVFFVSLGMFFDAALFVQNWHVILMLTFGFVVVKGAIATLAAMMMKFPPRAAWLAGVGLAQFGEFGFVLLRLGQAEGVMQGSEIDLLLNAGIISMFLTPLLVRMAPHVTAGEKMLMPLSRLLGERGFEESEGETPQHSHVVVVGYGVAGKLIVETLTRVGLDYVGIELNAEAVREAQEQGYNIHYADATSDETLEHVHVADARAVLVLINDPSASIRVVQTIRRANPTVPVFLRTRYFAEVSTGMTAGASVVIAEEIEGAVETLASVLGLLGYDQQTIRQEVDTSRRDTMKTARGADDLAGHPILLGSSVRVETLLIAPGSRFANATLADLRLREETGATVVGLQRGSELRSHVLPDDTFHIEDLLIVVGDVAALRLVREYARPDSTETTG